MSHSTLIPIQDTSQVGEARRVASRLAAASGLGETQVGRASIIATEAASNLLRHVGQGEILIQTCYCERTPCGIEIFALDQGRGMDIDTCMQDGFSTAGSQGVGLGAMRRQSDEFHIYSVAGRGTAILCRILDPSSQKNSRPKGSLQWGAVASPYPGEKICGDMWAARQDEERAFFLVSDGLGHGPHAAEASQEAVEVFHHANPALATASLLQQMHHGLKKTRGAAVAVAEISHADQKVHYAGSGNILGMIFSDERQRQMVSHNGIVGHTATRFQAFTYPWTQDSLLIMQSDGLKTRYDLNEYPGLANQHPALIAGVIFRDQRRGQDDATVLVAKPHADAIGMQHESSHHHS